MSFELRYVVKTGMLTRCGVPDGSPVPEGQAVIPCPGLFPGADDGTLQPFTGHGLRTAADIIAWLEEPRQLWEVRCMRHNEGLLAKPRVTAVDALDAAISAAQAEQ